VSTGRPDRDVLPQVGRLTVADGRPVEPVGGVQDAADGFELLVRELAGPGDAPLERIGAAAPAERAIGAEDVVRGRAGGPFAVLPLTGNRCSIVWSETTLVMPAFGSFTGGLNILDEAFASWLPRPRVCLIGERRLFPVDHRHLVGETAAQNRHRASG